MLAKLRFACAYIRERWIFFFGILVLLLLLQMTVSMGWISKNSQMFSLLNRGRIRNFFTIDKDVWTSQPSPFSILEQTTPFVVLEPKQNTMHVTVVLTAMVSPSSTRRVRRPTFIRHVNLTAKTSRPSLGAISVTTPLATTFREKRQQGSDNKPNQSSSSIGICPLIPKGLVGQIAINMTATGFLNLERSFTNLEPGGLYKPPDCRSRHKVAIVIPYRNREKHLKIFLNNMHPFLQKQQLEYGIYVVEQKEGTTFNRAMLMNIGFTEAMKQKNYDCTVFHDVDLLPEDDRNLYSCPEQPRHLSVAIDVFAYKLPYHSIFGGAIEMKREHFRKVNGFSNKFWGWGGEDDDMSSRVQDSGLHITRYPVNIARYKMIRHNRDKGNPVNPRRIELMRQGLKHYNIDGLNTLKYNLVKLDKRKLFTLVYVDVNERKS
ncbi:beta-1,4-N-acetylgalactosaminyltransferase bre-4-like isoform X2 [Lineus longissimus]|uniref:beta-1,4-N-acetylgalactosaminyltransferase bre-4-like isoform X2 n=1 Tax=Lineus longissimus TaxID=88925 RepID=UPI00315DF681